MELFALFVLASALLLGIKAVRADEAHHGLSMLGADHPHRMRRESRLPIRYHAPRR